ncbi:cytochrome P450 [Mycena latifolia]|nr:cytochrome P450 [Mycena latifolia]
MSQTTTQNLGILALAVVAACAITLLGRLLSRLFDSNTVATLPGPPSPSWIYGNMIQLVLAENYGDHEYRWQKQFGPVYRIKGCFGEDRLMVSDPQALKYIINNPAFTRTPSELKNAHVVFGEESVFCIKGREHRSLHSIMSGGISGRGVRSFLPVFVDVSKRVIHEWEKLCSPGSSSRIDVSQMIDHATLDIICDAALGLPVNTVQNPNHPLALSHLHILSSAFIRSKSSIIAQFFTEYIPDFVFLLALRLRIGPLAALLSFRNTTAQLMKEKGQDFLQRDVSEKSDVLSTIFAGRGSKRNGITADQLLNQIPIILIGGQDTTSTALAWAFHWLAQNPEFQGSLRQEILSANLNSQEGELDYDSMPLLNALLKETLRMFPPGPVSERSASEDCVLPLSSEIVTTTGERIRELPVRKGQVIYLAVGAYQRQEALWGPDANEFKPSRWLEGDPCKGQTNPLGPYGQVFAFLGGHRVCVGWRFAVVEMQVILTQLLAKFSFSLPKDSIVRARLSGTQFPADSEGVKGLWLSVERVVR